MPTSVDGLRSFCDCCVWFRKRCAIVSEGKHSIGAGKSGPRLAKNVLMIMTKLEDAFLDRLLFYALLIGTVAFVWGFGWGG